ncbi:DNA primase TraC [Mannheimia haemolytica]|nr:DNA primase TraC [Mannheimia haemolytica]
MNTQSNTQPKFDLYQEVTDKIIAALEQGTAPWLKPWDSVIPYGGMPCNAISGRLYSGINVLLLWLSAAEHGYIQRKWITAKAAIEAGGHVRKGEKSNPCGQLSPL